MFALLSIVNCPGCGEILPFSDMGFGKEVMLNLVKCEGCGREFQVRYDQETRQMVVEESKVS